MQRPYDRMKDALGAGLSALPQLPSASAASDALAGVSGAWTNLFIVTIERGILIGIGLYLAGMRGKKLIVGSTISTAVVSIGILGYSWTQKNKAATAAAQDTAAADAAAPTGA